MSLIKVGVLRGGPSSEYDVSLKTGKKILNLLRTTDLANTYTGVDIYIDKFGLWHVNGLPNTPEEALQKVDVIFNALHGEFGEDGKVQQILKTFSMPFTGSDALASSLAMNKSMTKQQLKAQGIKTPYHQDLFVEKSADLEPLAHDLFRSFPMPVVVKPRGLGSSIGISYAGNFSELINALDHARQFSSDIIVEEFITGKEIISGTIEDFRGKDIYTLLPSEVHHNQTPTGEMKEGTPSKIFEYAAKQSGFFKHKVPADLTEDEKRQIEDILVKAHKTLGISHYASADFIVSPKRGVYLIEINTQPNLGDNSLFLSSLEAAGVKTHDFIKHLLTMAFQRKAV